MTTERDEQIINYLNNTSAKGYTSTMLVNELAIHGINYGTARHLKAQLVLAGWTHHSSSNKRCWLAPGETLQTTAWPTNKPANIQFIVSRLIDEFLETEAYDGEVMPVELLNDLVQAKLGNKFRAALVKQNMAARSRLGHWLLVKDHDDMCCACWVKMKAKKKPDPI